MKGLNVAVIVAHPDDETLWAGGTILCHETWEVFVACLCRGDDTDRAPKFFKALDILRTKGAIACIDDGPEQHAVNEEILDRTILDLLPSRKYNLLITHSPEGEYTRHLRHEETGRAILRLWDSKMISAGELWMFAYEDGNRAYLPQPVISGDKFFRLSDEIWQKKYDIITRTYGIRENGFEALTTPRKESFWKFSCPDEAIRHFGKEN